jgi:hypothetical protein
VDARGDSGAGEGLGVCLGVGVDVGFGDGTVAGVGPGDAEDNVGGGALDGGLKGGDVGPSGASRPAANAAGGCRVNARGCTCRATPSGLRLAVSEKFPAGHINTASEE